MKVLVATDIHVSLFHGRYFMATQVSTILKRYYENFGKFSICGRIKEIEMLSSSVEDITDMIDEVIVIPSLEKTMLGLYNRKIQQAVKQSDFVICRCHGVIAFAAADAARKYGKPYFAESMGCAWDAFWNHGIVGKIAAPYMFMKMKQIVYNADYALYVTSKFLQNRYPCKNESVSASNVLIKTLDETVLQKRLDKISGSDFQTVTLMTTAAVDVRYKGQEFVIRAIPAVNKAGIHVRYVLVGGGDPSYLRNVAQANGVEEQVEFAGRQPLEEVFELLDATDIYIQPSLQEGLPRSVIEAMSRGCPCIGARTAGIPELISPECVVRRKSVRDIVDAVKRITNKDKMVELAKENFENAKAYQDEVLTERRNQYYDMVKKEINSHDNA